MTKSALQNRYRQPLCDWKRTLCQIFDFFSKGGLSFLEKCVGDADVNMSIRDSCDECQRRPRQMQPAGQDAPQKPPSFQLTSASGNVKGFICVSHIGAGLRFQLPE